MFQVVQRRVSPLAARLHCADLATSLHDKLVLDRDDVVKVSEVDCSDPGSPDLETVVLIMREGRSSLLFRVEKRLADVTEDDLDGVADRVWELT
ncbi:hypothetical protein LGH83_09135 [Lichenihabitans sp. PAMC28606]|uniref:hypothetical protein n=1 Tax=Lichenihabitans sp. PAMC28606 TaxID=2880932 RepID=UPI001D0A21C1|nr:hypothetical protein [Lichenihabitans sp. PAMC28606]UDL96317.1 hypothetical protein LGH83_09135 [Lichenihabitans sp. PAMC28606]